MGESLPPSYASVPPPALQPPPVQYAQQVPMQPMLVQMPPMGRHPQSMLCPNCHQQVVTNTKNENGLAMWLAVGGCCVVTGVCCWVPFLIKDLKDVSHTCPSCQYYLGSYKMIK
ncbi:hypothetical protein HK105_203115 [Polyrhizophydium stewartii]|uniref:LITAF domain-containing protein n=1 Tax=Polyrhizophydium stewartii TaxID=2732419 RepID=A0ABR4NDD5_9FUNG